MSRATYVKHLEQIADASKKTINDLTREVYELREQLKLKATPTTNERTKQKSQSY
jgi:predicted DNA-binding ribbon-helix-helix protein